MVGTKTSGAVQSSFWGTLLREVTVLISEQKRSSPDKSKKPALQSLARLIARLTSNNR